MRVRFLGHQKRYHLRVISLFSGTNISLTLQLRASHILSSTENSIEVVLLLHMRDKVEDAIPVSLLSQ